MIIKTPDRRKSLSVFKHRGSSSPNVNAACFAKFVHRIRGYYFYTGGFAAFQKRAAYADIGIGCDKYQLGRSLFNRFCRLFNTNDMFSCFC